MKLLKTLALTLLLAQWILPVTAPSTADPLPHPAHQPAVVTPSDIWTDPVGGGVTPNDIWTDPVGG